MKQTKYIIITGGVLSGLGKGVAAASIGLLFSDDYKVVPIKLDGYLNVDPGTMNPIEHGEVFILDDGCEVDMDFGHYERFIGNSPIKDQNMTMGKVYQTVREKERRGDYLGQTVQLIPHVTNTILDEIEKINRLKKPDIMLIEVGGTVGDMENDLYIEALRQLKNKVGQDNVFYIHLTYLPIPAGVKEQKTKPTQQSVKLLQDRGIWPDLILARGTEYLTESSKNKIALFCNLNKDRVISAPDVDCIYEIPSIFNSQAIPQLISIKLDIPRPSQKKLRTWTKLLEQKKDKTINLTIAGKYTHLEDSYASIIESLTHCSYHFGVNININWIETSSQIDTSMLKTSDAIIVPGGFGSRGIEGKLAVIKYARENKIPYLGICYGLQLAVVEFLRNVCKLNDANTIEVDPNTQDPVITMLDEQKNIVEKGGTMRLGRYDAILIDSQIKNLYKELKLFEKEENNFIVSERHRHRFEVNPNYIKKFEDKGLKVVGRSKERDLVEFIELDKDLHPYYVATQAHPELKSKLEKPAPLFYGLIKAALNK